MSQLTGQQQSVWADHIQAQPRSGLSQQTYCKQHALKPHCFWYWKRKIEARAKTPSAPRRQGGFVPVSVASVPQPQVLSVVLPNGVTLNGVAEDNLSVVQQLVGALL
jgi:hypothetical protein